MNFYSAFRPSSYVLFGAGLSLLTLTACEAEANADTLPTAQLGERDHTINEDAAVAISGDFVSFEQYVGERTTPDTSARSHLDLNWKERCYGKVQFTLDGAGVQDTWLRGKYRVVDDATTLRFYEFETDAGPAPADRVYALDMQLNASHDTLYLQGTLNDSPIEMGMVRTRSKR